MHQKEFTSNPNTATTNIFRDLQIFTLILASTLTLPLVAATATAPCFADSFPKHRKRPNAMQVHQSENDHDDDGWETVPSSKKKNKSLSEQRKPADDGTLPWVEFLPPQIQQQQKSFTPFLLLMVGLNLPLSLTRCQTMVEVLLQTAQVLAILCRKLNIFCYFSKSTVYPVGIFGQSFVSNWPKPIGGSASGSLKTN